MSIAERQLGRLTSETRIVAAKPKFGGKIIFALVVVAVSMALLNIVWIYESALRDGRYFDGWLLASAILLQIYFHARRRIFKSPIISNKNWRSIHIFTGYVIIAIFLSHTNYSLPDNLMEWAMWLSLMFITLSGIFGTYLSWAVQAKLRGQDEVNPERILKRSSEVAVAARNLLQEDTSQQNLPLPVAPYQAWIEDVYKSTLRNFFTRPQNFITHMIGSQRHMRRILEELNGLDRYLNQEGREKVNAIRQLVLEKDRLDFALVQTRLSKMWLLVHLPLSYGLLVLTILHVIINYSFASGVL